MNEADRSKNKQIEPLFKAPNLANALDSEQFGHFLDQIPIRIIVSELAVMELVIYANLVSPTEGESKLVDAYSNVIEGQRGAPCYRLAALVDITNHDPERSAQLEAQGASSTFSGPGRVSYIFLAPSPRSRQAIAPHTAVFFARRNNKVVDHPDRLIGTLQTDHQGRVN